MVIVTMKLFSIGGYDMENTHEYVEKLNENQKKADKNRKKGSESSSFKLPNKQHSTNK